MKQYSKDYLKKIYYTGFIGGNITQEHAQSYIQKFHNILNFEPVEIEKLSAVNIMKIQPKTDVIKTIFSTSAKATTSLCLSFLQIGLTKELKDRVAIDILVTHF